MRRSTSLISFAIFHLTLVSGLQAQERFDVATYTVPAGYSVEKDADSLRFTKESGGNYCVISLTRSVDGVGDSTKNFDLLWKGMAT